MAVLPGGEAFVVARDVAGLAALAARLAPLVAAAVGLEAVVVATLGAAGLPVVVVNPARVRAFGRALGQRAKTDSIDARLFAAFVAAPRPAISPLPNEAAARMADLVARHRPIIAMMVAERQRRRRFAEPRLKRSIPRLFEALLRELCGVDTEIDIHIRSGPAWRENEGLLTLVPGIGPAIARTMIAELSEIGRLGRRQIAALAGLAP